MLVCIQVYFVSVHTCMNGCVHLCSCGICEHVCVWRVGVWCYGVGMHVCMCVNSCVHMDVVCGVCGHMWVWVCTAVVCVYVHVYESLCACEQ